MVIHGAVVLAVAVQGQSERVVTLTVPVPPVEPKSLLVGDTVKVHAALCVMESVFPPAVMLPVRELLLVLATNE